MYNLQYLEKRGFRKQASGILRIMAFFVGILALGQVTILSAQATPTFQRSLSVGSKGEDVVALQKMLNSDNDTRVALSGPGSSGNETSMYGSLTREAVKRFQKKYSAEILNIGQAPTGFVGPKTLKKLNKMLAETVSAVTNPVINPVLPTKSAPEVVSPPKPALAQPTINTPTIISVYPTRVRRGDLVTVTGTNFTPANNTVSLIDGPVNKTFINLASTDGRTINFVFDPPTIKTMTEEEIKALPSNVVDQIEKPLKAANKTLTDALTPYKNISSEAELRAILNKEGHSFDEIYNFYFVAVENSNGRGISRVPLLHGLRRLPIPGLASSKAGTPPFYLERYFGGILSSLFPVARAEQYGGGINSGIIMICTCGDGYLTFMTDYNGGGTGLYWFSWGFQADAGAGFITPNWLGGYQTMSATCTIYVGEDCVDITANEPQKPWGTNL